MATTTNFGWETPDDTDLVKDGALAIRTLGSAIDSSLVDLKGGTTGQVLSKTSNTNMDFTWVTQAAGGGKVLQVVQDVSTTQESTTSTTFVDTNLSQSITPSSATSKILCIFTGATRASKDSVTNMESAFNLVRTSTQLAAVTLRTAGASGNLVIHGTSAIVYLDSPNTTSATTYKVQMRSNTTSGTTFMAIGDATDATGTATLTLIEIGA